jgi:hypothetical protein
VFYQIFIKITKKYRKVKVYKNFNKVIINIKVYIFLLITIILYYKNYI